MPTKIKNEIPPLFLERLKRIVPEDCYDSVVNSFCESEDVSVRINTLKITKADALEDLLRKGIAFEEVGWAQEALILKDINSSALGEMDLFLEACLYRQGLSSMLPVIVLDPKPGENILDMCAAPGSKTTQIAARMENQGNITAIDAVRGRYYRLRSVAQLMGAENISFHLMDARRFRTKDKLFDKILVDAPCSSEGRFKKNDPKTFAYWSPRKIKEMEHKQRGLLLSASRLLAPGGELVYSTCTFAPEENEGAVDWLLRKAEGSLEVQDVGASRVSTYSPVGRWNKRDFSPQVKKCLRVLPEKNMEGFFVALFKKAR